jgi:hypothetical protein
MKFKGCFKAVLALLCLAALAGCFFYACSVEPTLWATRIPDIAKAPSDLNAPDTLYEQIDDKWYQGTDTKDSIEDCLAWLDGEPPTAGVGDYATGNGGQSWNLDGSAAANKLAGRTFAIKPTTDCSLGPQTLGAASSGYTGDTSLPNVKGADGSPLNITLEPVSGSVKVNLSEPGQMFYLADSAYINMTLDGNLTLEGLTATSHKGQNVCDKDGMPYAAAVCNDDTDNIGGPLIWIDATDTLTMAGNNVTLCGNTSDNDDRNGGGVYLNAAGAKFVMKGGTIRDNYNIATLYIDNPPNHPGEGGGVALCGGEFDMEGGFIENNYVYNYGGGVYMYPTPGAVFNMSAGTISGNIADWGGGGVWDEGGTFNMSGSAKIIKNTCKDGMGGGGVDCGSASYGITESEGIFNMSGHATISGNTSDTYAGGGVMVWGGTFNMSGNASITGNTETSNSTAGGGGVAVWSFCTFNMYGGTITGNHADGPYTGNNPWNDGCDGGGVWCAGTFNFYGGEISGNFAPNTTRGEYQVGIGANNNGTLVWPAGTTGYFDANGNGSTSDSGDYNASSGSAVQLFGMSGIAGGDYWMNMGPPGSKQTVNSVFKATTPAP